MFLLIALWWIKNTHSKVAFSNQVVTWLKWGCQECQRGRPRWWRRPSSKTQSTMSRPFLLHPSLSPRCRLLFSLGLSILKHYSFHIFHLVVPFAGGPTNKIPRFVRFANAFFWFGSTGTEELSTPRSKGRTMKSFWKCVFCLILFAKTEPCPGKT